MYKIIKRLEIIKASIELQDFELLDYQIEQLILAVSSSDINSNNDLYEIVTLLNSSDFQKVVSKISSFINKMGTLTEYIDIELDTLKLELDKLEEELSVLINERNDSHKLLETFNREYNSRLGEYLREILRLQMIISLKKAENTAIPEQKETYQKIFEEAKEAHKEYSEEYQEQKRKPKLIELSVDDKKKLQLFFRKASKLCHPDMVSENLKNEATIIFQELNEAYSNNQLSRVKEILKKLQSDGIYRNASQVIEDKVELKNRIEIIKGNIFKIKKELNLIREDKTYQLIDSLNGNFEQYFLNKEDELKKELYALKELLEE